MTTEVGKVLRRIRIDLDERLYDMAKRIDKSSAFLSAIEIGKKTPPANFEDLVIKAYQLSTEVADELRQSSNRSRNNFSIQPNSILGRDTAGLLARKMNTLSDDQLLQIKSLLSETGD